MAPTSAVLCSFVIYDKFSCKQICVIYTDNFFPRPCYLNQNVAMFFSLTMLSHQNAAKIMQISCTVKTLIIQEVGYLGSPLMFVVWMISHENGKTISAYARY